MPPTPLVLAKTIPLPLSNPSTPLPTTPTLPDTTTHNPRPPPPAPPEGIRRAVKASSWDNIIKSLELEKGLREVEGEAQGIRERLDPIFGDPGELEAMEREKGELEGRVRELELTREELEEVVAEGEWV